MKNILIILLLLIGETGFAQTNPIEQIRDLQEQINRTFQEKNYQKGLELIAQSMDLYYQMDESAQQKNKNMLVNDYYNQACFYSLLKNKKKALEAFDNAVEAGYIQYRHALQDSDLDHIRNEKQFERALESVHELGDYMYILRQAPSYATTDHSGFPEFKYEDVGNHRIRSVKEYFKLDSVAGSGSEISRIIRVLNWAHNMIPHDGRHWPMCEIDALDLYYYSKAHNNRGINCRALAIFLNECYLSLGIPSRFITCMPKDPNDLDCHVINAVYSSTLEKWIWIDPSFNAYVTDENGTLLSIQEVRERIINGQPYFLNKDANWNNKTPQTKEFYLDHYMSKNLYWFNTPARNIFNVETNYRNTKEEYISLVPKGFDIPSSHRITHVTHDPDWFWQKPDINK